MNRSTILKIGGAALVMGAVAWVALGRTGPAPARDDGPPLPAYAIAAGDASDGALHVHGASDRFELVAAPKAPSDTKIVAYAFTMESDDAEPNPLDARVEVLPGAGSVRFRGDARALLGAHEVRIVIGVANASITRFEDALTAARMPGGGARLVTLRVPIVRD